MEVVITIDDKFLLAGLAEMADKEDPATFLQARVQDLLVSYAQQTGYDPNIAAVKAQAAADAQAKLDAADAVAATVTTPSLK
jgi:hypothetical protein